MISRTLATAAAAAGLAHVAPSAAFLTPLRTRFLPGLAGLGDPDHVALTFDDGPHPRSTPLFLRALDDLGVRATFFVLGRELDRAPGLGREIVAAGHEIALHGWDHRCLLRRGPLAVHEEFARAIDLIERTTGTRPCWVRAPYGVFSASSLVSAKLLGVTPVLWSCWGFDWTARATPATVFRTVHRGLRGGGTVLLHDSDVEAVPGSWKSALGALPLLAAACRERGLRLGPLAEHRTVKR
ncbi:polysaccharide deacetylase family protein [Amycolatopsis sp. H20-H5]|uniref:polysaccharide deacetylase family protein n=1 Tax=Amycolatopsis sp. H20-H5 TaxID=3046309 RepID=UPI002DB60866|nr:polysaccharide deacetylase family protein [Amycolatopsis sp. H20-H5]MEC3980563.1 polysaccharide deacetylase family protein [Amycolatopsis sp. H20-H5]